MQRSLLDLSADRRLILKIMLIHTEFKKQKLPSPYESTRDLLFYIGGRMTWKEGMFDTPTYT